MRTSVGYAGGSLLNPTYHNLGNHAECLKVQFDPARMGYADLLELFWSSHAPPRRRGSTQYRSAIFATTTEQLGLALASKAEVEARLDRKVYTEVAPLERFYPAEDYHQKYRMRIVPIAAAELRSVYAQHDEYVASTAVARVNGYASGLGSREQLDSELTQLGLSKAGMDEVSARWRADNHLM